MPAAADGQVLVRHHYLSLTPTARRMNDAKSTTRQPQAPRRGDDRRHGGPRWSDRTRSSPPATRLGRVWVAGSMVRWSTTCAGAPDAVSTPRTCRCRPTRPGRHARRDTARYGLTWICRAGETVVVNCRHGRWAARLGQLCQRCAVPRGASWRPRRSAATWSTELGFDIPSTTRHKGPEVARPALKEPAGTASTANFQRTSAARCWTQC